VVGGSGLVGHAIQECVAESSMEDDFVFTYCENRDAIDPGVQGVKLNLLKKGSVRLLRDYETAIYVAGSADHALAEKNPSLDLDLNVRAFLSFAEHFRGNLVLLSSQAVYYGLTGKIPEEVDHISTFPYGFSKQMIEAYSRHFQRKGVFTSLWVFRLMYTFGGNERKSRLIPRCAAAVNQGREIVVNGKGASYLNPLPSNMVAEVLVKGARSLVKDSNGFALTNLNHPEKITVLDIVRYLQRLAPFRYRLNAKGEIWPVRFWGNTSHLATQLRKWNMHIPNVWESLKEYYLRLLSSEVHER
jgi:nucleoside-diphosphate-sugar epimerase